MSMPFRLPLRPLLRLVALLPFSFAALPAEADPAGALRVALVDVAAGDWAGAKLAAEGPIAKDIVEWNRLRAGEALLGDYEDFLARRPDWPGLALIRRKGEAAVARSTTPERVVAWFQTTQPVTVEGSVALMRALSALGQDDAARAEAVRAWIALSFSSDQEQALLATYPKALAQVQRDAAGSAPLGRRSGRGRADVAPRRSGLARIGRGAAGASGGFAGGGRQAQGCAQVAREGSWPCL